MTNKKYFFYIVLTIPCDMIKKFILKNFKVRKIHYERKLALFLKKSGLHLKVFIQSLVQIGKVVSEKIQFEFLYVHDLGPRSRNDLDLQYSHIFI